MISFRTLSATALIILSLPLLTHAATLAQLQAQLASLLAQLAILQGSAMQIAPASTLAQCPSLSRNLARGLQGADVTALQTFLISRGHLASSNNTGFFGPLTEAAVKQFQCKHLQLCSGTAVSNGYGAVGPMTRASIASVCKAAVTSGLNYAQSSYSSGLYAQASYYAQGSYVTTTPSCTPLPAQSQTLSCPSGQTGSIAQTRTSSCAADATAPAWSTWQTTSNTCVTLPAPVTTTIQPKAVPTKILQASGGNSANINYLLQDVCVNAKNEPIPGDPATCVNHRDLKFGEFVPYLRTGWNSATQKPWMSSMSYPTQAEDGSLLIFKTYDYGGGIPVNGVVTAYRDFESYYPPLFEGFDLKEANGKFASVLSTQVNEYQQIWRPGCGRDDAWLVIPMSGAALSGSKTHELNIATTCPSTFVQNITFWNMEPTAVTYQTGKVLNTVTSYGMNLDSEGNHLPDSHIEYFLWTKEYGGTRWEAWFPLSRTDVSAGQRAEARQKCNVPDTKVFNGVEMFLGDCEDWTTTETLAVPYNPLTNPNGRDLVLSKNLLKYGDFAGGQTSGWERWHNGSMKTNWTVTEDRATRNDSLSLSCPDGCNGNGIYQDISATDLEGSLTLRLGGYVKANKDAQVSIAVFLINPSGVVDQKVFTTNVDSAWEHVGGTYQWNFTDEPIETIRYQVYLSDTTTTYGVDELYLVPSL